MHMRETCVHACQSELDCLRRIRQPACGPFAHVRTKITTSFCVYSFNNTSAHHTRTSPLSCSGRSRAMIFDRARERERARCDGEIAANRLCGHRCFYGKRKTNGIRDHGALVDWRMAHPIMLHEGRLRLCGRV